MFRKKKHYLVLLAAWLAASPLSAQSMNPGHIYAANIHTAQLYPYGNQLGLPVLQLNAGDKLELDFDDLDGDVKNYYYTFVLCNADWSESMLSPFDYIRGFTQMRLSTYRNSSIAFTRYTHYQALLPDRDCVPTRSGNYLLKVFLNGDTSQLAFTMPFMVVENKASVTAEIQQPYNGQFFNTHQKVQFKVNLNGGVDLVNALQQVKVVILQNDRWDNAVRDIRPTFYSGNSIEYNTEEDCVFPGGKEWRWLDLRSFRFQSDRVAHGNYNRNNTEFFLRPDGDRSALQFNYYHDQNGRYTIQTSENINPFWQGDYATVHFSYVPPGRQPFEGQEVYLLGELNNYNLDPSGQMVFNEQTGMYETSLLLKQGYYDYCYVTIDKNDPKRRPAFAHTEGNSWETENDYTILIYYRALSGRADQLIAMTTINSRSSRNGF